MARAITSIFCVVILALFAMPEARAHTTICGLNQATKFGYGPKMEAVVWVPRQKGAAFRKGVETFFERAGYYMSGVSSGDPDDSSYYWDQLPQSPSLDISFTIRTRRDRDFATIELSTFSFDCGATEDWRPHWRRFENYMRASEFKQFFAWRPIFGKISQTVSGYFSTPLWVIRLRSMLYPFSYALGVLLKR